MSGKKKASSNKKAPVKQQAPVKKQVPAGKKAVEKKASVGTAFFLKLTLTLLLITAVTSLFLGLVNAVTEDRIAALAEEARQEAMHSVITADEYRETDVAGDLVTGVTEAYSGDTLAGYCVEVTTTGFGGDIDLMVGVDLNGAVTGVVILDQSETAGLGANATKSSFLDQYTGRTGTITVKTGDNAIDALTGATITSKAVTAGVNAALEAVQTLVEGGSLNAG